MKVFSFSLFLSASLAFFDIIPLIDVNWIATPTNSPSSPFVYAPLIVKYI